MTDSLLAEVSCDEAKADDELSITNALAFP